MEAEGRGRCRITIWLDTMTGKHAYEKLAKSDTQFNSGNELTKKGGNDQVDIYCM